MKVIGVITAIVIFSYGISAQSGPDNRTRPFNVLEPIYIDIDGDGQTDTIQPRTYQTYKRQPGKRLLDRQVKNWIVFDLITSGGRNVRSFFAYNYGTAEQGGSYWVYSLNSAGDLDGDGRIDFVFYSGDDTTDERIEILNKTNRFPIHSRKFRTNDEW